MLNGAILFTCAALGCTITLDAHAGSRDKDDHARSAPPPSAAQVHSASDPIFVDWSYKALRDPNGGSSFPGNPRPSVVPTLTQDISYADKNLYVPMTQPGGAHGAGFTGAMNWLTRSSTEKVAASGAPVALLIRNRNCPFPFRTNGAPTSPNELRLALDTLPKLDYLFMDLEGDSNDITRNVREIVRMIRSHPNAQISNAFIGNYDDHAGSYDAGMIWAGRRNRLSVGPNRWNQARFYKDSGMNVSMPIAYPYETYSIHTSEGAQRGAGTSPNDRAAMLWTPVERVSSAARELPAGHKLVPWVTNYIPFMDESRREMYHAAPSPREDAAALIQHLRLRGADGYALFTPGSMDTIHPELDYAGYRDLALEAWASLDTAFEGSDTFEILTLSTTKTTGVVWSGTRSGNTVTVLVSNLSGSGQARSVSLPSINGLPESTRPVPDGTHQLFVYEVPSSDSESTQSNSGSDSNESGDTAHDEVVQDQPENQPVAVESAPAEVSVDALASTRSTPQTRRKARRGDRKPRVNRIRTYRSNRKKSVED